MDYVVQKLSPEVLAACFRFLGFRDLITASHVSRFWRSTALAFPDLWAHISLDEPLWNSTNLVEMAMSRAGRHAVDFEYLAGRSAVDYEYVVGQEFTERMAQAVSQHMHRLCSFRCAYSVDGLDTRRSAPLLREFVCDGLLFEVPPEFLGGSTSLRRLLLRHAIFPPVCRALSSVTHLRATFLTGTWDPTWHPGFRYIFQLCPRLEILHLSALAGTPGVELPAGPAPCTLREVVLNTWRDCSLVELYSAWALEDVDDVTLFMSLDVDFDDVNLAPFLAGATELSVTLKGKDWDQNFPVSIVAQLSGPTGRRRTFLCDCLCEAQEPAALLAGMLQAPQVRSLDIPLVVLSHAARLHQWPLLAHLSIVVYEAQMFQPQPIQIHGGPPSFDWAALDCLRALPGALDTLELHVCVSSESDQPTLRDAQDLKACLASLRDCIPREVHVHGFYADVARKMPVLDGDDPRVVLD